MQLRISNLVNDSIVDGPGIRLTIFTQGCIHNCNGCHNPQTHPLDAGQIIEINEIVKLVKENPLLSGITLSGGEPFLQADVCAELSKKVKELGFNVWIYTGYKFETLLFSNQTDWIHLLKHADVLVDGPFQIEKRSLDLEYRGSSNQRIIDLKKSMEKKIPILFDL